MAAGKRSLKIKREPDNADAWLITYADAVTLVLCFFIILFSVSEPQESSFKKISESFAAAGFVTNVSAQQESDPVQVMREEVEIMIESNALEKVMSIEESDAGIQLELSSSAFYQSGSARFKREAVPILLQIVEILRNFDFDAYEIKVEGHTDDVPMRSAQFPSNWELSAARATNIVRFLIANDLKPELMQATGHAETKPKVPNLDAQGTPIPQNREINRRVVIKIERVD
jgi:chemotaxis protein MotB